VSDYKDLIEEARRWAAGPFLGRSTVRELDKGIGFTRKLVVALEEVTREMHARELHHFEEKKHRAEAEAAILRRQGARSGHGMAARTVVAARDA